MVAVVDDIGPGVVPVWSPNFPDALYWKATPREVMRVAVGEKTKYLARRKVPGSLGGPQQGPSE